LDPSNIRKILTESLSQIPENYDILMYSKIYKQPKQLMPQTLRETINIAMEGKNRKHQLTLWIDMTNNSWVLDATGCPDESIGRNIIEMNGALHPLEIDALVETITIAGITPTLVGAAIDILSESIKSQYDFARETKLLDLEFDCDKLLENLMLTPEWPENGAFQCRPSTSNWMMIVVYNSKVSWTVDMYKVLQAAKPDLGQEGFFTLVRENMVSV
jgi:hypothetical protein